MSRTKTLSCVRSRRLARSRRASSARRRSAISACNCSLVCWSSAVRCRTLASISSRAILRECSALRRAALTVAKNAASSANIATRGTCASIQREAIDRRREVVVDRQRGEERGKQRRPEPAEPGGHQDRDQQQRLGIESRLQPQRQEQADRHAGNGHAVSEQREPPSAVARCCAMSPCIFVLLIVTRRFLLEPRSTPSFARGRIRARWAVKNRDDSTGGVS